MHKYVHVLNDCYQTLSSIAIIDKKIDIICNLPPSKQLTARRLELYKDRRLACDRPDLHLNLSRFDRDDVLTFCSLMQEHHIIAEFTNTRNVSETISSLSRSISLLNLHASRHKTIRAPLNNIASHLKEYIDVAMESRAFNIEWFTSLDSIFAMLLFHIIHDCRQEKAKLLDNCLSLMRAIASKARSYSKLISMIEQLPRRMCIQLQFLFQVMLAESHNQGLEQSPNTTQAAFHYALHRCKSLHPDNKELENAYQVYEVLMDEKSQVILKEVNKLKRQDIPAINVLF